MDAGDQATAIRLFRSAHERAPDFTPILRRLGTVLVGSGQKDEGLQLLQRAVALQRSPENLFSLAAMLAYPTPTARSSDADLQRALDLAKEASTRYGSRDDSAYLALVAQVALSLNRIADFREAERSLVSTYPDEMFTHYAAAILAAIDGRWTVSEHEVREAERRGLPHEDAERLLASGIRRWATVWRVAYALGFALVVWAAGLLALLVAGKVLSTRTLTSIEHVGSDTVSDADRSLRTRYRKLVTVAAAYYYVSLPFVALLVIAGAGGVVYGFLALGEVPVKLVAIVVIGALITLYKMAQSLFIRVEADDPGRSLEEQEAPALWALAREVAATVGTRAVDQIRVTPGTELAVYERGTRRERARDQGRRVLVLGVGVLNDFRCSAFRAVVAHEYGHFSHRDTAGGDVALRVRQDVIKFAIAMAQHGQAVIWNPAFHFLRCYDFLFRRITHGATRLQEILADRVAAQKYGAASFEEGLRHVIRRTVEFQAAVDREIQLSIESQRACRNLYDLRPQPADDVEARVVEAMERPTTEDDTHPGPLNRFRLVSGIRAGNAVENAGLVWDLFVNRAALTAEMSEAIESRVRDIVPQPA